MLKYLIKFVVLCSLLTQWAKAEEFSCNTSVLGFLNTKQATLTIPHKLDNKLIKSVNAVVYFRESHGGYRSCFSLKDVVNAKTIPLFCEVQWSDFNSRGGNDWLGSIEGGILGDASSVKSVPLTVGASYNMLMDGEFPFHNTLANSLKTNINDPIFDNDPSIFTFYEESKSKKVKSLDFRHHQEGVSTIMGFEDEYLPEIEKDYNDIIIEMCLQIEFK